MRRYIIHIYMVAVALAFGAIVSCTKNEDAQTSAGLSAEEYVTLDVEMPEVNGDKTFMSGNVSSGKWVTSWYNNDNIKLIPQGATSGTDFANSQPDGYPAKFPVQATKNTSYYAVYPAACISDIQANGTASITIPTTQSPKNSYFTNAVGFSSDSDILFAGNQAKGFTITSEVGASQEVEFKRMTSVLRLRFNDVNALIPQQERIESVVFSLSGTNITGTSTTADLSQGTLGAFDSKSVTLDYSGITDGTPIFNDASGNAWVDCCASVAPCTIQKGETLHADVTTTNFIITFETTVGSNISLNAGNIRTFNLKFKHAKLNSTNQASRYYWYFGNKTTTRSGLYSQYVTDSGDQTYCTIETMVMFEDLSDFNSAEGDGQNFLNTVMGADERFFIRLIPGDGKYVFQGVFTSSDNTESLALTSNIGIASKKWHHVAMTFAAGNCSLVVDGTEAVTGKFPTKTTVNLGNTQTSVAAVKKFTIGTEGMGGGTLQRFLNGYLCQTRVWIGSKSSPNSNACRSVNDLKRHRLFIAPNEYEMFKACGLVGQWLYLDTNPGGNCFAEYGGLELLPGRPGLNQMPDPIATNDYVL